ncbi:MAG TPA: CcmD family protein [Anaerolineae bacterium]|jgi:CcmD family protein|nr:CcmD family protein [Anaerolineae bacterium]
MTYLFAAYAVFWGLTFAYVFTIASRQKRLENEIKALRQSIQGEK